MGNFGTLRTVLSREVVLFSEGPLSEVPYNVIIEHAIIFTDVLIILRNFWIIMSEIFPHRGRSKLTVARATNI